jgi:hypothetical protein
VIIKAKTRTNGGSLADYLLSEGRYKGKNERVEVWEANGIEQGDSLKEILSDFECSAIGTRCEKPLFHVQMRTAAGENLTRVQWLESVNRLEKRLDLVGHERVIVAHTLEGLEHAHIVWNRIGPERKAAELSYFKRKCTDQARELEKDFGLRELSPARNQGKLSRAEEQQAVRHGQKPQEIQATIRECWQQAKNGQEFVAALERRGYVLAQGDRRDFVIIDARGGTYSAARVTGSKPTEVRERLEDIDRTVLLSVAAVAARKLGQIVGKGQDAGLDAPAGQHHRKRTHVNKKKPHKVGR